MTSHRHSSTPKAEEALFHKFGLKSRVIPGDNQAVGIGGKAKVLGKLEMPSGMGGVIGKVKFTVVDSPGVPPLTPCVLTQTSWCCNRFEQQHDGPQGNRDDDLFESLAKRPCGSQAD